MIPGKRASCACISPFSRGRVLGYRWPANETLPEAAPLPVLALEGRLSQNEA